MTKQYDAEKIAPTLVRLRNGHGYSQVELAQLLCIHSTHPTLTRNEVSRWERGERIPSEFWIASLAAVLTVPIDMLRQAIDITRGHRVPSGRSDRELNEWPSMPGIESWLTLHHGPNEIMIALAGVHVDQLRTVLAPVGPPIPVTVQTDDSPVEARP